MGAGMEEVAQLTLALKHLSWGKEVALDRRPFFGRKHGSLHRARRARSLGRRPDRQACRRGVIQIEINRTTLEGTIDFVGRKEIPSVRTKEREFLTPEKSHSDLSPDPRMPDDSSFGRPCKTSEEEPGRLRL